MRDWPINLRTGDRYSAAIYRGDKAPEAGDVIDVGGSLAFVTGIIRVDSEQRTDAERLPDGWKQGDPVPGDPGWVRLRSE